MKNTILKKMLFLDYSRSCYKVKDEARNFRWEAKL